MKTRAGRSNNDLPPSVVSDCVAETQKFRVDSLTSLSLKPEVVAITYFMNFHVETTLFSYLPAIWYSVASNQGVKDAATAISLAALATKVQQPSIIRLARSHYATALATTNRTLSSPDLAHLDASLLSVLLLSTFEALTFQGRASPESWMAHVAGATALLELRGKQQLENELGQHLFNHANMIIQTSCAQRAVPIPLQLERLQQHASTIPGFDPWVNKLSELLRRIATLRSNMSGMLATKAVQESLLLEQQAIELLEDIQIRCPYEIVKSTRRTTQIITYQGYYHEYSSQIAARHWNILRMFRIYLNEWIFCAFNPDLRGIVLNHPLPGEPLYEGWEELPQLAAAYAEKVINDVLASVPYSLDCLQDSPNAYARFLVWPLAGAASSEICPPSARRFAINRLGAISERHGLHQAAEAVSMLEGGGWTEDW